MKKNRIIPVVVALALAGLGVAAWWAHERARPSAHPTMAAEVETATVARKPMPLAIEAIGRVEPVQQAQIRAQANGVLRRVRFREGAHVKRGQVLFELDDRPLRAQLAQARANLARDQAQWRNARTNEERLKPLAARDYVTPQEYDAARANADAARAAMQASRAAVSAAQAQLDYARITAPFSGRTGAVSVKPGDLVAANGTQPLVVINRLKPIDVSFSVPEASLDAIRRYDKQGTLRVEVYPESGSRPAGSGRLVFMDNSVDVQTGTIALKGELANDDEALWPGEFVRVRLILTVQKDALVIPETALQTGQSGDFVYTVENGRAKLQPVQVDRRQGGEVVIRSGVRAGETVITQHPQRFGPGTPVRAGQGRGAAAGPRRGAAP